MAKSRFTAAIAIVGVVVLGACGGGSEEPVAADSDASSASTTIDDPTTTSAPEIEMPDLQGLTETEANAALRAAGIDDINADEVESLEDPGTVLRQVPSPGSRVRGPVTVVIAVPLPPMPDYVGSNLAEARDWYEDRGVNVVIETVLDDSVPPGTVLATTPKAGEPVIGEVLVNVAERPFTQALSEFEWPATCRLADVSDAEVNGEIYPRSVVMGSFGRYSTDACAVDINLSRDWQTFKTTIGLVDNSHADAMIRFEVLADGNSIFRESVGLGTQTPVSLDVTDVLRLRIVATPETEFDARAVWGEPVIQGLPPEE